MTSFLAKYLGVETITLQARDVSVRPASDENVQVVLTGIDPDSIESLLDLLNSRVGTERLLNYFDRSVLENHLSRKEVA